MVRYRAFLSYSHSDKRVANWLHHALETYRLPSKLVGLRTSAGLVPNRLKPIFKDRDELSASADLSVAIQGALESSQFLIVICSPAAAASRWVNQEILSFKRTHGEESVLAVIADGEPHASVSHRECFPSALRRRLDASGELSDTPTEPIAADIRAGGDGRRLAKLKLVAALTGVQLDDLVQRETQRRLRRLAVVATAATVGMLLSGGLALYANDRRLEAIRQQAIAEREAAVAQAASDFLVGTFVPANPGTENPRNITALSILSRSAQRAHTQLATQPVVQARLVSTLGQAYNNLGLPNETRALMKRSSSAIAKAGAEGASAKLVLAAADLQVGEVDSAMTNVRTAERLLGPDLTQRRDIRASAAIVEGMIHTVAGDTDGGVAAFDRALNFYRATPAGNPQRLSSALAARGALLSDAGQFSAAETSLAEALAINRRTLGDRHLLTGQSWFALAQNAFLAGNLPLAERRITNALAIERQMLDGDNPIIADALSMQGQIFHGQGRLLEAERSLQEAIAIYQKAFGGPHYLIGIAQIYLALVESERGRTGKALRILDEAKRNYDASYGKLHANHGDLLVNRATILARAGRRKEALADCVAGMKILDQTLGADAAFTKQLDEVCAKI